MHAGEWIALLAVALSVTGCGLRLSYLLGSLNNRVGTLSDEIANVLKQVAEDRSERRRIWERLEQISERVTVLE